MKAELLLLGLMLLLVAAWPQPAHTVFESPVPTLELTPPFRPTPTGWICPGVQCYFVPTRTPTAMPGVNPAAARIICYLPVVYR